jgi:hypothetical protein
MVHPFQDRNSACDSIPQSIMDQIYSASTIKGSFDYFCQKS